MPCQVPKGRSGIPKKNLNLKLVYKVQAFNLTVTSLLHLQIWLQIRRESREFSHHQGLARISRVRIWNMAYTSQETLLIRVHFRSQVKNHWRKVLISNWPKNRQNPQSYRLKSRVADWSKKLKALLESQLLNLFHQRGKRCIQTKRLRRQKSKLFLSKRCKGNLSFYPKDGRAISNNSELAKAVRSNQSLQWATYLELKFNTTIKVQFTK